jgi:hypothetical protein
MKSRKEPDLGRKEPDIVLDAMKEHSLQNIAQVVGCFATATQNHKQISYC